MKTYSCLLCRHSGLVPAICVGMDNCDSFYGVSITYPGNGAGGFLLPPGRYLVRLCFGCFQDHHPDQILREIQRIRQCEGRITTGPLA